MECQLTTACSRLGAARLSGRAFRAGMVFVSTMVFGRRSRRAHDAGRLPAILLGKKIEFEMNDEEKMIIDGHVHAAREFSNAEQMIEAMNRLGIDKIALCPSLKNNTQLQDAPKIPVPTNSANNLYFLNRICRLSYRFLIKDQGDGNAFVYSLAQQYPKRIIQFYWVNPLEPTCLTQLKDALRNWSIMGIKLHQACNPFRSDCDEMQKIAEFASNGSLPIFIHLYSKEEVKRFIELATSHPKTIFIVAHLIGLEVVAQHATHLPNVYYEISGDDTAINEKRIQYALKIFGPEHIIFGSDAPFINLEHSLERAWRLQIPEAQKEKVLGGNLGYLLKLEESC